MEFKHVSVLANEVVKSLCIKQGGIYVDGTLGGAGHSELICKSMQDGQLIGIDRDPNAIEAARRRLADYKEKVTFVNDNFFNIKHILQTRAICQISGALLDLGVSSHQFDTPERGFSYRFDAKLDMRMDNRNGMTAADVVNTYEQGRLAKILFEYGEEKYAGQIARKILQNRPIETTFELVDVIKSAIPPKTRYADKHPAKRTFQALRIEVNGELERLAEAVVDFANALETGGRLAIITFHSLEDRIVKTTFANLAGVCTCPKDFPVCVCGKQEELFKVITKKPILPSDDEIKENPRSASAKLRVLERVQGGF